MLNNNKSQPSKGILLNSKGDCTDRVHSDQMDLRTVRREAGPQKRQPKVLEVKPTQGGPSGSSPLRSDASHASQVGG